MSNVSSTLSIGGGGEGLFGGLPTLLLWLSCPLTRIDSRFFAPNFLHCFSTQYIFSGVGMSVPLEHYIVAVQTLQTEPSSSWLFCPFHPLPIRPTGRHLLLAQSQTCVAKLAEPMRWRQIFGTNLCSSFTTSGSQ